MRKLTEQELGRLKEEIVERDIPKGLLADFDTIALDGEYWYDEGINKNQDWSEDDLMIYTINDPNIYDELISNFEYDLQDSIAEPLGFGNSDAEIQKEYPIIIRWLKQNKPKNRNFVDNMKLK